MDAKYLILGATGSIGSNLANKLYDSKENIHLVGRNADELKSLSDNTFFFLEISSSLSLSFCSFFLNLYFC